MYQRTCICIAAAGLAACAGVPPKQEDSPASPTAVFEMQVVNSGINGVLPFEVNEKHYVRAGMRRDEHSMKGTGFPGALLTAFGGEGDTSIARLDRDVRWTLDHGRREYTECPAHGCPTPDREAMQMPEPRRDDPPRQEKGCVMRIASHKFDVKTTGKKRLLNGFSTDQYAAAWVVSMRDSEKRTTTSTLSFDVWTAPLTRQMRDALGVERAFGRAYLAKAPSGRAIPTATSAADRARLMPPEVTQMMLGHLTGLSPADRAAFADVGRQLSRIPGHPISTRIEWRLAGDACAGTRDREKRGEMPILSVSTEVKSLKVEAVRDSVFAVPPNYRPAKATRP